MRQNQIAYLFVVRNQLIHAILMQHEYPQHIQHRQHFAGRPPQQFVLDCIHAVWRKFGHVPFGLIRQNTKNILQVRLIRHTVLFVIFVFVLCRVHLQHLVIQLDNLLPHRIQFHLCLNLIATQFIARNLFQCLGRSESFPLHSGRSGNRIHHRLQMRFDLLRQIQINAVNDTEIMGNLFRIVVFIEAQRNAHIISIQINMRDIIIRDAIHHRSVSIILERTTASSSSSAATWFAHNLSNILPLRTSTIPLIDTRSFFRIIHHLKLARLARMVQHFYRL
mmetsp:Transcript_21023/g.33592  ORF Transcript_21023/g.33592 Transcript_21023/m.33592 type:complete len:278 (+) Transcript_21023:273-1106(+)